MALIESFGLTLVISGPGPLESRFVQTTMKRHFILFYAQSFLSHSISGAREE